MPHDIHEAPFNELQTALRNAIRLIPLTFDNGRNQVAIELHTNARVDGKTVFAYPDVHIRMCSLSNHRRLSRPQPYFFLECAFSQSADAVTRKFAKYIASFPTTISVVMMIVKEAAPGYASPPSNSDLAKLLANKDVKSWERWKPVRNELNELGPVITNGITWIDISRIEIHAWVRTGSRPIDITSDSTDTQDYAMGVSTSPLFLIRLLM